MKEWVKSIWRRYAQMLSAGSIFATAVAEMSQSRRAVLRLTRAAGSGEEARLAEPSFGVFLISAAITRHLIEEQVAPPPLHDEAVPMREYDEDDDNIRRHAPVLRRVIILVAVIIAVPVMMWTITIFIRSFAPTPTLRHLTSHSLPPKPQAAQSAPAPLLTDAARTAGDGLASLPDPNSGSPPLALPPEDAPPSAASPEPAETAPNAPAAASGEAAAVTDSAPSAATAETTSSEAVTPVQRDRLTATGPATGSTAPVGPVPLPRVRPADTPVDTPPVPSSPPSVSPLLAHPAAYGYQPGLSEH